VRSAVVIGDDRRQLVDHGSKGVRTSHREDRDSRLADSGHGVDQLHLLRGEVLVRGVGTFSFGAFVGPCRSAADGENDDVGRLRHGDCGRNVRRLGRHHTGARDGGDIGLRQELSERLGERHRRVVGREILPAIGLEHRRQLGRDRGSRLGRGAATEVDPCHRDVTAGGPSVHHLQPGRIRVGWETDLHVIGVRPDDRDLRDVAAER
jgi:hypothetical protein